jgi:GT2 family glycosyltransferase
VTERPADPPRVDVGVVTWNTRDLTVTALRRLLDSDQGCRLEVLVHDNASSDGTADAVRREVPEADVEDSPANLGFAAGVNRLLERSTADWFLALNSDAWPAPGAIGALVAAAERHPRAAAVAPRLERPDGTLEHSTHPFPGLRIAAATAVGLRGGWARRHMLHGSWDHDEERRVDWAVGAALLLRRRAVAEIGGFDESFFMYVEDLEWCQRADAHGWEIWFTPSAVVTHVGNASGEQRYGSARTATWLANTYVYYRRHHGPASAAAFRALNAAGALRGVARGVIRRDRGLVRFWSSQVRLHLAKSPAPRGSDRRSAGDGTG